MDEMLAQFKTMTELTDYASAQYRTIVELSKEIQTLKEENRHLQDILAGSTPLLEADKSQFIGGSIPSEKIIAEIQLGLLKMKAMSGPNGSELTLEETKKVETYAKILANLKLHAPSDKPLEKEVKQLSNSELLAQLQVLPVNG